MSTVLGQIYAPFNYPDLTMPRRENTKFLKQMNLLLCRNFGSIE
jgi:hypothetical protein